MGPEARAARRPVLHRHVCVLHRHVCVVLHRQVCVFSVCFLGVGTHFQKS